MCFGGYPVFPTRGAGFDFLEDGATGFAEEDGVAHPDGADALVLHEVAIEILPVFGGLEIIGADEFLTAGVVPGVNIQLDAVFKETPKGLEDPACKVGGPFAFKEFVEEADTEDDPDGLGGIAAEVGGDAVELGTT